MAYTRYGGQPNVYDTTTGKIVTHEFATANKLFEPGVIQDIAGPNPYASQPVQATSFGTGSLTPYEKSQIVGASGSTVTPGALTTTTAYNLAPTPQEIQGSTLTKELQDLNEQLLGKSEYQTKMEGRYGVDDISASINDLTAKLQGYQNEAAKVPLDEQSRAARGTVLTAGLQADQNQKLRDIAVGALGVSTILAAMKGQLATAQSLADKAVAAKYDPILEQISVTKANLELIMNDPMTTLAEKNRALAQQQAQDQLAQQTEDKKALESVIWDIATTAATNGNNFKPSGIYTSLSQTLDAISKAPSKEEALSIAVGTGLIQDPIKVAATTGGTKKKTTNEDGTPKLTFNDAAANLQAQAIPLDSLSANGTMTLAYKKRLLDAGLSAEAIDWMWGEVAGGTSFEDIRDALRNNKDENGQPAPIDISVLDIFVQTLQDLI